MNVYITNFNANSIINQIDLSEIDVFEFKKDMRYKWFNKGELRQLKALYTLFSDPKLFNEQFNKVKSKTNNTKYVFGSGNRSFHLSPNCNRLLSDYQNILIPDDIVKRGLKVEFIEWCEENKEIYLKYPDQFKFRLKNKFKLELDPFITKDNSGYEEYNNYSPEEIEKVIHQTIFKTSKFINRSSINHEVISLFGLQSFNYKNPEKIDCDLLINRINKTEVIEILKDFELNYKKPLLELFKIQFRIKNNRDLKFDKNILTTLGFKQCGNCLKNTKKEGLCNKCGKKLRGDTTKELCTSCWSEKGDLKDKVNSQAENDFFSQTVNETYNLLKSGKSIDDISKYRNISKATILKHLKEIDPIFPIKDFSNVKPSNYIINKVESAYKSNLITINGLKDIYTFLDGKVDYDDIRLALFFFE
jgi:hypothetical protein